jgi:hypothetical protein
MPKVSVSVPHHHTPDAIVQRAQPYIEKIVEDFQGKDLHMQWSGHKAEFSFKSLAFTIKGQVAVEEEQITVNVDLPFAAMMFKEKVEKAIKKNLTKAVELA